MVEMSDFLDSPVELPQPLKPTVKPKPVDNPPDLPTDGSDTAGSDSNGGNPPDNPDVSGKILYDYSHDEKKEAELIKIEKEKSIKPEKKKRKISIEISNEKNKERDPNEKDVIDKAFHSIFGIFDSLFGFFGLGKDEKRESGKSGRRKDDREIEK